MTTPDSLKNLYSRFETVMQVRPDDIDMNQHVHNSRYFDYVLAARYDQMERCYRMPMSIFIDYGFSWVIRKAFIEYKRPLGLGDWFVVQTWIMRIENDSAYVGFEIRRKDNNKVCCDGEFHYVMVNSTTGRAEKIPEWMREKYEV